MKSRWHMALAGIFLFAFVPPLARAANPLECSIRLIDAKAQTGILFRHNHGGSGQGYIVEGMVAGLVLFDYNAD